MPPTDRSVEFRATNEEGQITLVVGLLPTLPVRYALVGAYQQALGLGLGTEPVFDEQGNEVGRTEEKMVKVGEPDTEDMMAISFAALGACWQQPRLEGCPTFRQCNRDPIEFGEEVETALWDAGYRERKQLSEAGNELLKAMTRSLVSAKKLEEAEAEGFEEAQAAS